MIEIKGNIAIVTRKPLHVDLTDMVDVIRQSIDDHLGEVYGFETVENMEFHDYQALINRALDEAKIKF